MPSAPGSRKLPLALAAALLALMALLMFQSAWDDTPNADEIVTVVSGYSHLIKKEYRLDIGNPPLLEDLSAVPLLFMNLHEPWDRPGWGEKVEDSDPDPLGREFLYHTGNDADAIMRAARAPMILFAVAFGWVLFWWTRKEFGSAAALLTLFFYTFSPTFLAHGRFVTTDVSAAAGFFIGTIAFLRFLKNPSWRNVALAGLAMGFAFLTKYSTVALIPITLMLAAAWVWSQEGLPWREVIGLKKSPEANFVFTFRSARARTMLAPFVRYLLQTCCIIAVGYLVIYPIYLHHIWNYAPENQVKMAELFRENYGMHGSAKDIVIWTSDKSVLRPWAQYFLGLLATLKASNWGQGVFFMGKVYPTGMRSYFPFVYLVKEPLALHLLTIVALLIGLSRIRRPIFGASPINRRVRAWVAAHFTEFAFLVVLGIYWTALIRSNMNIGVRHLLPAFPLTFVLVSNQIVALLPRMAIRPVTKWASRLALGGLLTWQAVSVLRVYPSYLAYFNEITGGPDGGWRYVNDSNLDWGQDVKRLAQFVERRGIPGIRLDFFGPADPPYYLKEKYLGSLGCTDTPKGWVAVSAMVYPGSPWAPQCDYRTRLPMDKLVTKIGYSIFVFHVD